MKNINIISFMFFLALHCSVHGDDMLLPYWQNNRYASEATIIKNDIIMKAIKGNYSSVEQQYDRAKENADGHFYLFTHNDTSQNHLATYQENFFNECIIATCGGRSDLLLSMPTKPWSSNFISPILKSSKNTLYLSDLINSPINDVTNDTLLHLAIRTATYHNDNKKYAFDNDARILSKNQYPKMKDVIDFLIVHKSNINAQNVDGNTPLHIACKGDDLEMVTLLLKAGANPNIKNRNNNNAEKYIANNKNKQAYEAVFQKAREKSLWTQKLTKKERKALAAEQAEFDAIAQNQLKQKTTAQNSAESTPEKAKTVKISPTNTNNSFEQIIYTDNIAYPNDVASTDLTASTTDASRQIQKNIPKNSFGSLGDERPGQMTITKPRPKTAGSSRKQITPISSTDNNPIIIDNQTKQYSESTTTTTIRPSSAKPKAPSSKAPDAYLAARNATQTYTATSKTKSYSEKESVSKVSML